MKLERKYCPQCGEEIIFTYERFPTTFIINDSGDLEKEDNVANINPNPFLVPHCSKDKEHTIEPPGDTRLYTLFEKWYTDVEDEFYSYEMEDTY